MNSETGGVANIIRQICLNLQKNKINTMLVCANTELGKTMTDPETIRFSDHLVIHIVKQNKNPLLGFRKSIYRILDTVSEISLIHVHTCFSTICDASLKYAAQNNIPCIFTPHGKFSPAMFANKKQLKKLYYEWYVEKNLNNISKIIVSSPDEAIHIRQLGIKNDISYVYNGYYRYKEAILSEKVEKIPVPYFLFLGYLDPRKQPDLLIKAFSQSSASKKYKLVLAGPDSYSYLGHLKELVSTYDLADKVIFPDRVLGYDKWYLLKHATALLLPSKAEGWPVVIAEAIGAKLPLIISKACNFSEITTLNIGIEIADFNISNWANAIDTLCDQMQHAAFKRNLSNISESFAWENIVQQWINEYNTILKKENT
ncbi:MAG: glycosyltransferase [Bacteroidales bacterium]|jgi:glycosyltransferase involved in cell wall biosynthesis|nr:glycosyltransferase [Bacteroidales bacterium]